MAPPEDRTEHMITWSQFGAYASVALMIFAGGVGLCWFVLWRE
jgi:hypothetical protein